MIAPCIKSARRLVFYLEEGLAISLATITHVMWILALLEHHSPGSNSNRRPTCAKVSCNLLIYWLFFRSFGDWNLSLFNRHIFIFWRREPIVPLGLADFQFL
jgi:hypothetical protein